MLYVHDLETDRILLDTTSKAAYKALPEDVRDAIQRSFLWSPPRDCWISRAKRRNVRCLDLLRANGVQDNGTTGERLAFADQVREKQIKASVRADRAEALAIKAGTEASARFNSPAIQTLRDMQGEPVKLGHHSAPRHLRLIDKADNDMRKGVEAVDRRDYYQNMRRTALETAEGARYSDPAFLGRRIKESEAEERLIVRRLEGRFYEHSDPTPISADYRTHLDVQLIDVRDRLGFYRHCLNQCDAPVWNRETLSGKVEVKVRGDWKIIVKLNRTTVSVPNSCYPTVESQRKYALKYPYHEVKEAR